MESY
jgi:uncharacterized protein YxeA